MQSGTLRLLCAYGTRSRMIREDASSLHRSQILEFVSDAGSGSRIFRPRRTILLLPGKKNSKTLCLDSFILNHALKQTPSVCLRVF
jgi:hypothetical protein